MPMPDFKRRMLCGVGSDHSTISSGSSSVWHDGVIICLIFGHFKRWVFAQWHIKFSKESCKCCQMLNEPIQNGQSFVTLF